MAQKISFKLEVFEGPMDLLLRLISKHQLNIYDIEITSLLEQYLRYMDQCREQDLELAGEFLEMAARLIYIKTASLLPRPEEAQKEKQALQGALIEYALCKQAAVSLQAAFVGDQIFVRRPMQLDGPVMYAHQHHPNELLQAYLAIGQKQIMQEPPVQTRLQTVVNRNVVSVTSKVVYILRHLRQTEHVYLDGGSADGGSAVYLDVRERSARVAVFLAVLELTRTGTICISEDNTYIYLRPKEEKE